MDSDWLYNKFGGRLLSGKLCTLAIVHDGPALGGAISEAFLSRLGSNSIYLTLRIPAEQVSMPMIALNMLWVDATGTVPSASPGFMLTRVPSARSLVALSAILGTSVSGGSRRFIVVNSLNDLLDANGPEKTLQFVDFLLKQMKNSGAGGMFLLRMSDRKTATFAAAISPLFDRVEHS